MRGIDLLEDIGYIDDRLVQEAAIDSKVSTKVYRWSKWTRWGSIAAGFAVLCIATVVLRQNFGSHDSMESATTTDTASSSSQTYSVQDAVTEEVAEIYNDYKTNTTTEAAAKPDEAEKSADKAEDKAVVKEEVKEETQELEIIRDYSMELGVDGEIADAELVVCYAEPKKGEYYYFYKLEEAMKAYAGQKVQYYVTIDVFGDCTNTSGETVYEELTYNGDDHEEQSSQIIQEYERLLAEGYEVIIEENELRGYFTEEELDTFVVNPEYGYAFRFAGDF